MKKILALILILSFPLIAIAKISIPSESTSGVVTKVTDGDTLKIKSSDGQEYTLRILGLDTPEKYPTRYGYSECYGVESSTYAEKLITDNNFLVFTELYGDDKYSRDLAEVYLGSNTGELLAERLIKEGYGFVYKKGVKTKHYQKLIKAELFAKRKKLGLWNPNTCNGKRIPAVTNVSSSGVTTKPLPVAPVTNLSCKNVPRYCKDVKTREEAQYYLLSCNATRFDIDKDGIACEDIK